MPAVCVEQSAVLLVMYPWIIRASLTERVALGALALSPVVSRIHITCLASTPLIAVDLTYLALESLRLLLSMANG